MSRTDKNKRTAPALCPVCGEDVPPRALACPDCGADHNSGWREDADSYDGIDLPGEFDYNEFVREEFGRSRNPAGIRRLWWISAIVLVVLTLVYLAFVR